MVMPTSGNLERGGILSVSLTCEGSECPKPQAILQALPRDFISLLAKPWRQRPSSAAEEAEARGG